MAIYLKSCYDKLESAKVFYSALAKNELYFKNIKGTQKNRLEREAILADVMQSMLENLEFAGGVYQLPLKKVVEALKIHPQVSDKDKNISYHTLRRDLEGIISYWNLNMRIREKK